MRKIYYTYPEISNIKSRVLSRKYDNDMTYLSLEKTIFMPSSDILLDEPGFISGKRIKKTYEKNGKVIHLIEGRESRKEVILTLDKDIRYRNLSYATGFFLFKIFFNSFYLNHKVDFSLNKYEGLIYINDWVNDFDPKLIENQINYAIDKGLRIESSKGILEIKGLGKTINNLIAFDNTYKVKNFKIKDIEKAKDKMTISFLTGKDI
ncbi:MAG: hypothetical protein Q4D88_01780 [Anaerococcus sp.]|nr:hypothetical protein [Anaerococcus sp.]